MSKSITLKFPEMPAFNQYTGAGRGSWQGIASLKKIFTDTCELTIKGQTKGKVKDVVITSAEFLWVSKHKRMDMDNIESGQKFIWDGLVKAGVIENDGWKHTPLERIHRHKKSDNHKSWVELTITYEANLDLCKCGNPKMDESNFCKECV